MSNHFGLIGFGGGRRLHHQGGLKYARSGMWESLGHCLGTGDRKVSMLIASLFRPRLTGAKWVGWQVTFEYDLTNSRPRKRQKGELKGEGHGRGGLGKFMIGCEGGLGSLTAQCHYGWAVGRQTC